MMRTTNWNYETENPGKLLRAAAIESKKPT